MNDNAHLPLSGVTVLDLSRMLPGALVARSLLDLGARVIKVEDPGGGDPWRHVPPLVGGVSAGFAACYRGALSAALDLHAVEGQQAVRRLARGADVLVESFRPGTLESWGVGADRLLALNPALVVCSLSGYGRAPETAGWTGHDLNFVAATGLLDELGGAIPRVQLADVGAALLAVSSILAALLRRRRTSHGGQIEQPLASGALPFLLWAWADAAAGGPSLTGSVLAGRCPSYRTYRCADGLELAVGALEPKFWTALVDDLGLPHLAGVGLDSGEAGARAAEEVQRAFARATRHQWLARFRPLGLPVSPVRTVEEARSDRLLAALALAETTTGTDGRPIELPGPFLGSLGRTPEGPAPALGEHTREILDAIGQAETP